MRRDNVSRALWLSPSKRDRAREILREREDALAAKAAAKAMRKDERSRKKAEKEEQAREHRI
jgi:hypothetical protein